MLALELTDVPVGHEMRVRITKSPPHDVVDGIRLDHFWVGRCYEVSGSIAALLVAEGWAAPAMPHEAIEETDHITADLLTKLSRRYERPAKGPRGERRFARFPIDQTAAVAHDWPDRRGRGNPPAKTAPARRH